MSNEITLKSDVVKRNLELKLQLIKCERNKQQQEHNMRLKQLIEAKENLQKNVNNIFENCKKFNEMHSQLLQSLDKPRTGTILSVTSANREKLVNTLQTVVQCIHNKYKYIDAINKTALNPEMAENFMESRLNAELKLFEQATSSYQYCINYPKLIEEAVEMDNETMSKTPMEFSDLEVHTLSPDDPLDLNSQLISSTPFPPAFQK